MECKQRVSEECRGSGCDSDGNLYEVRFRDYVKEIDAEKFAPLYATYQKEVNDRDLSGDETVTLDGLKQNVNRLACALSSLYSEGTKIKLGLNLNGEIIGFMLYHIAYDCILIIEGLYIVPSCRNNKLGKGLLKHLGIPIKKVLFQTRKANPPQKLFNKTEDFIKKLHETDTKITWEMSWQTD